MQEGSRNEVQGGPWLPAESVRPRASELHERLWHHDPSLALPSGIRGGHAVPVCR